MARDFDGLNDRISIGDVLDVSSVPISITAWIRPDTLGEGSFGRILDKRDGTNTGFAFFVANTPNVSSLGFIAADGAVSDQVNSNSSAISTGVWQYVAVTYDGSNARFYVNGTAVGAPALTRALSNSATALMIGNRPTVDRTFDGRIADVRLYNVLLSAQEVAMSRYKSIGKSPIGWWPLWGASPETDIAGGANNGTVTGALIADGPPAPNPLARRRGYQGNFTAVGGPAQLAGSISSNGNLSGDLATTIRLIGVISNSSALAGDLQTAVRFEALISGSVDMVGDLLTTIQLGSLISSNGDISGSLSTAIQLEGVVSNNGNVIGDLSTGIQFAGLISNSGDLIGNLLTQVRLSGLVFNEGDLIGDLTTTVQTQLEGVLSNHGNLTGDISTKIQLEGVSFNNGDLAGDISTSVRLEVLISNNGNMSGDLLTSIRFAGLIGNDGDMSGDLLTAIRLSGLIGNNGDLAGDISTAIRLSGQISVSGVITGDLTTTVADLLTAIQLIALFVMDFTSVFGGGSFGQGPFGSQGESLTKDGLFTKETAVGLEF